MKKAHPTRLLAGKNNNFFGVVMSDGGRAEHTYGLDELARFLDVERIEEKSGLWRMRIGLNHRPQRLAYYTDISVREVNRTSGKKSRVDIDILYVGDRYERFARKGKTDAGYLVPERGNPASEVIASQWSQKEFSIAAYSDEAKAFLKDLNRALEAGDIYLRSRMPDDFRRTHEVAIFIESLTPDDADELKPFAISGI